MALQITSETSRQLTVSPRFVHQYDEEYAEAKSTRRPGRPASMKEDLLKMKVTALEKEHRDGFCEYCLSPQRQIPSHLFADQKLTSIRHA